MALLGYSQNNFNFISISSIQLNIAIQGLPSSFCFFVCFIRFFLMWAIFKVFIKFVTIFILFYVLVFWGYKACGILTPQPGIKPTPPALEGKVLTTGLPGKSVPGSFWPGHCGHQDSTAWYVFPPSKTNFKFHLHETPLPLLQATLSCPFPEILISPLIVPCYLWLMLE